ncbi:putative nucleosome assembly protein Nap1 [Chytriomyces cf. hyalinus JEL632]|nr:putative nucleosome assembly protein Nap1 [Chytriomyces cf. hyalinus JEL632]
MVCCFLAALSQITEVQGNKLSGVFQHPAVLGALQQRLNGLVGKPSSYIADLPADVKRRVDALRNIQDKHSELEAKFREEVLALEKKYLTQHQPLYDQRAKIVSGDVEPTDAEAHREPEEGDDEEEEKTASKPSDKATKGIPEFWLTALKTNSAISEFITERDEEALKALVNIKYAYLPDNPGFKLEFFFSENEFFSNTKLEKTYFLINSPDTSYGDVVYDHAEGTKIEWKDDKDLSVTVEVKTQRHKTTNKTRTVKKTVPAPTFFSFFNPPKPPTEDDEDIDEDIDSKLEMDYEIGELIKEKIIPHAVDWFTGKALQYEDDDEYDEFDEDEFDGGDDEDDDDEEGGAGADGEKPAECKQQ